MDRARSIAVHQCRPGLWPDDAISSHAFRSLECPHRRVSLVTEVAVDREVLLVPGEQGLDGAHNIALIAALLAQTPIHRHRTEPWLSVHPNLFRS
jgi:hypothetical protein